MGIKEISFLQSWNWGEFQKMMGRKIWRLPVLVIKIAAKRGKFLFIPHGTITKPLLGKLKKIAKQEKCSFIRIAPICENNEENKTIFRNLGFRDAPIHMHPELTWQLDLEPSEDELLMNMRKTTRYLIKQGIKNRDLEILQSQNIKDIEIFDKIYKETAKRHQFAPFSLKYLKNEFLAFSQDKKALIFLAKYKGEILAAAMIIFWQGIGFYHQGASSQKYAKIPASYLLQWEAIKEAKNRGCKTYNFWGIASETNHPWKGLTLFKKGFGGYEKAYVKTQDLPLSWRYRLTHIFEKIRKLKRYG